jgi:signal transduction histidine kinase
VFGREAGSQYHSDYGFALSNLVSRPSTGVPPVRRKPSRSPALRRLADQVLEVPDLAAVAQLLTRTLPDTIRAPEAALLLWNRKLDTFEALSPGETRPRPVRPGRDGVKTPAARFLLAEGEVLETPGGEGEGVLVPLMARSGLVGMLVLGPVGGRRKTPFRRAEAHLLSLLAARAALAIQNHLYQRELIDSERMAALGAMAGMLAHDFRGPMTVIRGYAETLREPGLAAEEVRRRADLIVHAVDRLERMTMETLDFARVGGRLARRTVDAAELVDAIAAALAEELPTLELVLDFRVPPGTPAAVDVDKLRRAAGNIAANARDAMGGAGRFHLSAELQEGHEAEAGGPRLVLVLADEGPGVPEDIRERVFEPFVTKGKKGGTGLGLAVARRFVEDHGGSLELLPGGPGARFRIVLPLRPPEDEGAR